MREIKDKQIGIDGNYIHEDSMTTCIECNKETKVYWDIRYNGYRASCDDCGINWSES